MKSTNYLSQYTAEIPNIIQIAASPNRMKYKSYNQLQAGDIILYCSHEIVVICKHYGNNDTLLMKKKQMFHEKGGFRWVPRVDYDKELFLVIGKICDEEIQHHLTLYNEYLKQFDDC